MHRIPGKGRATGFVGHLKFNHKYYLITSQHVLQSRRDDPCNIKITFEHPKNETKRGDELFDSSTRWFTDNKTDLQDNVWYHIVVCT